MGREFADLRLYFSEKIHDILVSAAERTNGRIRRSLRDGHSTSETARFQSPGVIARAVWIEFPPVFNHVETLEIELRSRSLREQCPGLVITYQPVFWIYHHWALLLDFTKPIRLGRTSTIMIDGTYLGTDKIVHFVHMGYMYHGTYRRALNKGLSEAEATRRAVALGTGSHLLFSENTLLGMLTTGIRSNADLAANYAGLKFYQNLTAEVRLGNKLLPPLLVREKLYWKLNDHVSPHADFFAAFVTDHWDEALNPNTYAPGIGACVRQELQRRCDDILSWYRDRHGLLRSREQFAKITDELSTYFGEDYGHKGRLDELVSVANTCYEDAEPTEMVRADRAGQAGSQRLAMVNLSPPQGAAASLDPTLVNDTADRYVDTPDRFGRTALWWAACDGQTQAIERLVALGANVDIADIDQECPLHCAARWGHVSTAEVLLEYGADVNARAALGLTPLHLAVRELRKDVAEVLLEHGADVRARDEFGCTPLHDIAARDKQHLAVMLLNAGADPGTGDDYGTTPLHRAARAGHAEVVSLFIAAGADATVRNVLGKTPYDEATQNKHRTALQYLPRVEEHVPVPSAKEDSTVALVNDEVANE